MKKNQTFVRASVVGKKQYRQKLDTRLSKLSALADVIAELERHN